MIMSFLQFTLSTLAVWRLTHLLQAEDGPWDLVFRLRRRAGDGFFGALLDCFYCLSLWIAVPFAARLSATIGEGLIVWLALSGAAILLQRFTDGFAAPTPVANLGASNLVIEDENHVMLRKKESGRLSTGPETDSE